MRTPTRLGQHQECSDCGNGATAGVGGQRHEYSGCGKRATAGVEGQHHEYSSCEKGVTAGAGDNSRSIVAVGVGQERG